MYTFNQKQNFLTSVNFGQENLMHLCVLTDQVARSNFVQNLQLCPSVSHLNVGPFGVGFWCFGVSDKYRRSLCPFDLRNLPGIGRHFKKSKEWPDKTNYSFLVFSKTLLFGFVHVFRWIIFGRFARFFLEIIRHKNVRMVIKGFEKQEKF
jgi:hypothetical protein